MQLPVKAHYAALAMLALAEKYEAREPLPARVISQQQQIPSQFLGQILQQLRSSGLISSTRGSSGGFLLERPPSQITLANILDVICSSGGNPTEKLEESVFGNVLHGVWNELQVQERKVLESLSLTDLLARAGENNPMFYI